MAKAADKKAASLKAGTIVGTGDTAAVVTKKKAAPKAKAAAKSPAKGRTPAKAEVKAAVKGKTVAKAKAVAGAAAKAKVIGPQVQYAALPFRLQDGKVSVLLVTSRETRRWILPKGKAEKNLAPHQVAELEAFEEGGVKGEVTDVPFTRYMGSKRLDNGVDVPCEMVVYPLKVREVLDDWREKSQRERRWLSPAEAATLVGEEGLIAVLLDFATLWP